MADEIDSLMERADRLANQQLLEGAADVDKRAKLPEAAITQAYPFPSSGRCTLTGVERGVRRTRRRSA